jgi:tetratricopeptide (TPR) repeat protein
MAPMKMNWTHVNNYLTSCVPKKRTVLRTVMGRFAPVLVVLALAGCSAAPPKPENIKLIAPTVEPIGEYLSRAQSLEAADGGREQARHVYREAAKAYPADKRPWLRLAQSYFDARDYGNAVLAAEEVVQRDSTDVTAQSLLAVSGLRLSTAALSALRSPTDLNSSTRQEAESMAQNLRLILGEPVLVPPTVEAEPPKRPKAITKPRAPSRAALAPSLPTPPVGTAKSSGPSSPFGALN